MSVRKRNGYYHVDFRIRNKRIQQKIPGGITNKSIALKYENDLKHRMLKGEIGLVRLNPSLAELILKYLLYSKTNKASSSFDRDELALRNFSKISGIIKFSQIIPLSIEKYKEKRIEKVSKRTVDLEISTLKAMLNKSLEWELIDNNPIKSVGKMVGPKTKTLEFLSEQEIDSLLRAATSSYRPIFIAFLRTGLRKNELVYLEWNDIDFRRRQIRVINKESHSPKGNKERYIPIDDELLKVLKAIPKKRDYVFPTKNGLPRKNNLLREVQRTAKKAKIKHVTIHMLRHTFASHLVMNGVDLPTVKELLGHASINTTMIYAHLAPGHLKSSVNKLPF